MKTRILGIALFLIASLPLTAQQTTNEKDFLLNYFEETSENLEKEISGLSEEQMHFKPSEEKWSVSQCVEHIILTEKLILDLVKIELEKPDNPERKGELKFKDEELIEVMKNRSKKAQAREELKPEGKYSNAEAAMADFNQQRRIALDYIQNTPLENFRNHISDSPFGPIDAYQSMSLIPGHTERHTLQIEEVKADENFPSE